MSERGKLHIKRERKRNSTEWKGKRIYGQETRFVWLETDKERVRLEKREKET